MLLGFGLSCSNSYIFFAQNNLYISKTQNSSCYCIFIGIEHILTCTAIRPNFRGIRIAEFEHVCNLRSCIRNKSGFLKFKFFEQWETLITFTIPDFPVAASSEQNAHTKKYLMYFSTSLTAALKMLVFKSFSTECIVSTTININTNRLMNANHLYRDASQSDWIL